MWIWTRAASAKWEDVWHERLLHVGRERLVSWRVASSRMIKLQAYLDTQAQAKALQRTFGGTIRKFDRAWKPDGSPPKTPLSIRGKLLIYANRETFEQTRKASDRKQRLYVPAELAFGTGEHATTATCLRWIIDLIPELPRKWSMLDAGTGSGILALAAARFGADPILGFDFDPTAVRIARRNARENRLAKQVTFERQDVTNWTPPRKFDLVCANIYGDILIASAKTIRRAVASPGYLLLSGMLNTQAPDCIAALQKAGLTEVSRRTRGKWTTALLHNS